jgi:hypothetical protein
MKVTLEHAWKVEQKGEKELTTMTSKITKKAGN